MGFSQQPNVNFSAVAPGPQAPALPPQGQPMAMSPTPTAGNMMLPGGGGGLGGGLNQIQIAGPKFRPVI